MLIVCTQDEVIRNTATQGGKGGAAWQPIHLLPEGAEGAATEAFAEALQELGAEEPLCLSAHGNNTELGDAGEEGEEEPWSWTTAEVAELLHENAPEEWTGPILIHACAENVANFSAGLAVELGELGAFEGLWCYGYNRAVPANEGFPPPVGLGERVDLQGTQV